MDHGVSFLGYFIGVATLRSTNLYTWTYIKYISPVSGIQAGKSTSKQTTIPEVAEAIRKTYTTKPITKICTINHVLHCIYNSETDGRHAAASKIYSSATAEIPERLIKTFVSTRWHKGQSVVWFYCSIYGGSYYRKHS